MVTVGMNYDILPGKEGEFEKVFDKVLGVMNNMDGHKESNLYCNVGNKQSYLIVSEWNDVEAFNGFIASEQFKNVANWGKESILAGRPRHEVYGKDASAASFEPVSGSAPSGCPMHAKS